MKRRSDLPLYVLLRAVESLVRPAPRPAALAAGAALGRLALRLGLRRQVTLDNLARAFPAMAAAERARLARRMYEHFGRATVDSVIVSTRGPRSLLSLVDGGEVVDVIERQVSLRQGVLILTGHVGNWELGGAYLAARGYPLAAVIKAPANEYVAAHTERVRQRLGIETILMHEAVARVPDALRAGKCVALVADQGAIRSEIFAPFFGVPTQTPVGPGLFAARTGAPILFGGMVAAGGGRYRLMGEVLDATPAGDVSTLARTIAERFRQKLEALVRTVPEQYLWSHRLWKRQPASPAAGAPAGP